MEGGGGIGREMEAFIKAVVSPGTLGECVSLPLCVLEVISQGLTDRQIPGAGTHGHKRESRFVSRVPPKSLFSLLKEGKHESIFIHSFFFI